MEPYTDSHFHLETMQEKGIDIYALDITSGMDIGCVPEDIQKRAEIIKHFKGIRFAVAAGPWCVKDEQNSEALISALICNLGVRAVDCIGEIGLDYFRNYGTRERQKELFIRQIELANDLDLPIAIHSRDADKDMIEILKNYPLKRRSIMHCFSSDHKLAEVALEQGFFVSFAGNITYKGNEMLREVLKTIPDDRLLLETDSPYLTPIPYRGRLNTPERIATTYDFVASLKGMELENLKKLIKKNFDSIFAF